MYPKSSGDEGRFSFFDWRGIPMIHSHQECCLVSPVETWEEPRGPCCKSKGHRVSPQFDIRTDSMATTWMELQVSCRNVKGGQTPLLQFKKKPKFPTLSRNEAWHPISNLRPKRVSMTQHEAMPETPEKSIQTTGSLLQQETEAGIFASTPDASQFPCHNSRRIQKCLCQWERRPDIPERPSEVHCHPRSYSSGTTSFLL